MVEKILVCAAGAQGSIGTTIAAGSCLMKSYPEKIHDYLITHKEGFELNDCGSEIEYSGWDIKNNSFSNSYEKNKPFKEKLFNNIKDSLDRKIIFNAPDYNLTVADQVKNIKKDIAQLRIQFSDYSLVGVDILPASDIDYNSCSKLSLKELYDLSGKTYQDLAYIIAFVEEGIPFINFSPNPIELPVLIELAEKNKTVICGRDGKTGQTYWKVVIASAFAARRLKIEGWYSTNILGNDDGLNLKNSANVNNKIAQKSYVLDKALGYEVKNHIVRIDYYPPRGDNKEANDVIDYLGFMDEEMSMRINLLCKDSILAAPMIIDMVKICAHLKYNRGYSGVISELGFFFKYPVGGNDNYTFQDQLNALKHLVNL